MNRSSLIRGCEDWWRPRVARRHGGVQRASSGGLGKGDDGDPSGEGGGPFLAPRDSGAPADAAVADANKTGLDASTPDTSTPPSVDSGMEIDSSPPAVDSGTTVTSADGFGP